MLDDKILAHRQKREVEKAIRKSNFAQRAKRRLGVPSTEPADDEVVTVNIGRNEQGQRVDPATKTVRPNVGLGDTYDPTSVDEASMAGTTPAQRLREQSFGQPGPSPLSAPFGGVFGQTEAPLSRPSDVPAPFNVRPPQTFNPSANTSSLGSAPQTATDITALEPHLTPLSTETAAQKFDKDFRSRYGELPTDKRDVSWWRNGLSNLAEAVGRVGPEVFARNSAAGLGLALGSFGGGAIFQDGVETRDLLKRQASWQGNYDAGLGRALKIDEANAKARMADLSGVRAATGAYNAETSRQNANTNADRLTRQLNQDQVSNFRTAAELFMKTTGANGLTKEQADSFNAQFGEALGFRVKEGHAFKVDPSGRGILVPDEEDNVNLVNPYTGQVQRVTNPDGSTLKMRKPSPLVSLEQQTGEKTATDTAIADTPNIRARIESEYRQRLTQRFTQEAAGREFDSDDQRARWVTNRVEKELLKLRPEMDTRVEDEVKANAARGRNAVRVNRTRPAASNGPSKYKGKSFSQVVLGQSE